MDLLSDFLFRSHLLLIISFAVELVRVRNGAHVSRIQTRV